MIASPTKTAILALLGATCLPVLATAQTTITVAGYSGVFEDGFRSAVIEPFEAANPGIRIDYVPTFNSAQLVGTLYAQRAAPTTDVVIMDLVASKGATDQGLFEKIDASSVPAVSDLVEAARVEGVAGVPLTFDYPVVIYNPKLVDPAPTGWATLSDPKYAGRIAVSAPPGLLGVAFTIIQDHQAGGADPVRSLAKGIERVAALAPSVKSFESKDWYPSVANGEVAMAVGWNARAQIFADQTDGAVLPAIPDDGLVRQVNTVNLVEKAPHRAEALEFIDYALGAEAQAAIARKLHYSPTSSKVALDEDARRRTGQDSRSPVVDVDWIAFAPLNATMTQEWRRKVVSAGGN